MRKNNFILIVLFLLSAFCAFAQPTQQEKNPRILILLDGSSSMLHEWVDNDIRFDAAAQIVDKLMDSVYTVNKNVEFALRVYGHQSPTSKNNCFDSKLEVMFSRDNYTQMMLRMAALTPLGISPIAYSIQQAAENDMKNLRDNKYSLILITDGGESCEGDICAVVEQLLKNKIDFKPYILSLVDYAPLKQQYDCLGDYLLVTKKSDIEPVVGKIVESYRKTFIQPTTVTKLLEASRKTPSVLKVTTPEVKVVIPDPEPEPVVETPKPQPKKKEPVATIEAKPVKTTPPSTITPPVVQAKPAPTPSAIVVQDIIPEPKPKQDVIALSPKTQHTLPQIYTSRGGFQPVKLPNVKAPVIEPEPEPTSVRSKEPVYKPMPTTTATTTTTPIQTTAPAQKSMEYTVTRQDANETSLIIHFTNGKGKYYESAPEIVLRDRRTNEVVYKFNRNVDVYGKPRPQNEVPPGTYNLTITGKDGYVAKNIEVRANQTNSYALLVTDGSLGFQYLNNPKRPVTEFAARVSVALKRGAVNKQYCSEIIGYEPENYHVIINTNPISQRNVDLDFGVTVYLTIEEPGQIKVLNPNQYKNVQFYYQLGERYQQFKPMDEKVTATQREFLIQPGRYRIAYILDPRVPDPKPTVKSFIIKSNTLTEITLD